MGQGKVLQEWLGDEHLLLMLDLLREDVSEKYQNRVLIENTHFATLLAAAYNEREKYMTRRSYGWIRDRGNQLANGNKAYLATIVNQNNTHWVGLIIDFEEKKVWYGDSLGNPMDATLRDIVKWWTFHHTGMHFTHANLVTSQQCDSFSCGMLAWDTIQYHLNNFSTTQMDPTQPFNERLKIFLRLIKHHNLSHQQVSDL